VIRASLSCDPLTLNIAPGVFLFVEQNFPMTVPTDQRQKDLIRDRFTRTVEAFGDFAVSYRAQFADRLVELTDAGPADRAVDLACGPGTLALQFAKKIRWVCGVDLTPAMLDRARRTAAAENLGNLSFMLGDALALPIGDGTLDVAVTSYSLHHMADGARVISEMARVVKRGGRVGIIDIFVPEDPRVGELNNRIERLRDPSHTCTLTLSEFDKMLTGAGLRLAANEVHEMPRSFNHWMQVAGWKPGDFAYEETRKLMESSMADDSANFHPRYADAAPPSPDGRPDIQIINTALFSAAEKI
jgi:ubiquinone/menaquinone biosynthesis C-methylase UbiE